MTSARPDPGPRAVVAVPRTAPVGRHRWPLAPALVVLLVLILPVWQTLAGIHALGHLLEGDADACPICHLAGAPPLPSLPLDAPAPLPPGRVLAPARVPERPILRPSRAHRARAPPS